MMRWRNRPQRPRCYRSSTRPPAISRPHSIRSLRRRFGSAGPMAAHSGSSRTVLPKRWAAATCRRVYHEYVTRETVPVRYVLGRDGQHRPYIHTLDLKATKPYKEGVPFFVATVDLGNARTVLSVPLLQADTLI